MRHVHFPNATRRVADGAKVAFQSADTLRFDFLLQDGVDIRILCSFKDKFTVCGICNVNAVCTSLSVSKNEMCA
jgi:hypothetical protein